MDWSIPDDAMARRAYLRSSRRELFQVEEGEGPSSASNAHSMASFGFDASGHGAYFTVTSTAGDVAKV